MRDHLLSGVDVFVTTVETGSFAAAAQQLNLTRSAVAKTIARIEARLAVKLFHRTTRRLTLTDDGQIYFEHCTRALAELSAAKDALDTGRQEIAGRVRISMPVLFGRRCVAPVLTQLTADHPRLELEMSFSDRPVDLMREGFDLAIRNGEIGDGTGLKVRALGPKRMVVSGSPTYLARRGRPQKLDDLFNHSCIVYSHAGRIRTWTFPSPDQGLIEMKPTSQLRFDDLEAIADAAEAGHGLAWLPIWLIRDRICAGALIPLLQNIKSVVHETHALWPETPHPLPPRVRIVIDALAAALPSASEL